MTKKQVKYLSKLNRAREMLKLQDPTDVALVKGVYDSMLRHFGMPEVFGGLTDAEFKDEWEKCRVGAMHTFDTLHLMSSETFAVIWYAYDLVTTEDAMAYA